MNLPVTNDSSINQTPRRRWINNRRDLLIFIAVFILISLAISIAAFLLWTANPAQPGSIALAALASSDTVQVVETERLIVFDPANDIQQEVGFLFYPGALVDPRAYAPILRPVAEQGYLVVTGYMPLNLAIFNINAADAMRSAYPEIESWVIGGHSMGGAMASRYALDRGDVAGLALVAAFPFGDLTGEPLTVTSIYGDSDGLIPLTQIDESRSALPAETTYVQIEGANHAQFGDYGIQRGDLPTVLPLAEQHAQTVEALLQLLDLVE